MSLSYPGTELELFATARHWKSYVAAALVPYIRGRVLDVGAGIGGNIRYLSNPSVTRWIALEPDPELAAVLSDSGLCAECSVVNGTIAAIPDTARFDTILYMDVLEHIADDRHEVEQAARLLAPGGCLVILAPAHQFLFSPFDAAIGHHRRYGLKALRALAPANVRTEMCRLMDSVGFFASLANRLLLRQSDPTRRQIAIWDRLMVRASRVLDPLSFYRIGKSALLVWRAAASGN
jgi:SAM-dependent methyltransferase